MFFTILSRSIAVITILYCAVEQRECAPLYYKELNERLPAIDKITTSPSEQIDLSLTAKVMSTTAIPINSENSLAENDPDASQNPVNRDKTEKLMTISNMGGDINEAVESNTYQPKINRMQHSNPEIANAAYFKSFTANKIGRPKGTTKRTKKQLTTAKASKKETAGDQRQGRDAVEPSTTPSSPKGSNDEAQATFKANDCNFDWKSYVPIKSCGGFIGTPPPKCRTVATDGRKAEAQI